MADPIAMLQSVLDPEMPLSERAAIEAAIAEIERLRGLGDAMASMMRSGSDSGWDDAIDAWQEGRRG